MTDFLRTAVYGPERASYWALAWERAQARDSLTMPARARVEELEAAIADLEARYAISLTRDEVREAARAGMEVTLGRA